MSSEIYTYQGAVIVKDGAIASSQSCCCGVCCRPICSEEGGIFSCDDFSDISGVATSGYYFCNGGGENIYVTAVKFVVPSGGGGSTENITIVGTKNGVAGGGASFKPNFPSTSGDWYTIYSFRYMSKADASQQETCGEPPNTGICYPIDGWVSVELRYYECTEDGLEDKTSDAFTETEITFNDVAGDHVGDLNYWYCDSFSGADSSIGTRQKYEFKVRQPHDVTPEGTEDSCDVSKEGGPFEFSPVWPTDGAFTSVTYYCDGSVGELACNSGISGSGNPLGNWIPGASCATYDCNSSGNP